jgi:malate dehydrogenase (oxaloacetate-decarboxylating)
MDSNNDHEKDILKRLTQAQKPAETAMRLHAYYKGKMSTLPKCPIRGFEDFSIWYTPGVAAPCSVIANSPEEVYQLTNKGNTIAVISDGSRVLGLGNIGPEAGLPVMEGKCLLFKYLGGIDAVPIMLDVESPDDFIETALRLQPGFGGFNLEDIAQPKCFKILERLQSEAHIPVWHDDQQGTATVTLAALINALRVVGKKKEDIRIAFIGTGAAGVACSRLIFSWGVDPEQAIMVDEAGILGKHRHDIQPGTPAWHLCQITNPDGLKGGIPEALQAADVLIAYSTPGPGIIRPEWIKRMAKDPIVFACANPVPEIWPWEAKAAGAAIIATGRSDFPNQVNNSLCFPGIFRGVLDVRASKITDEMCFAAATALADANKNQLDQTHILPQMMDMTIYPLQAAAVGMMAQQQNIAQYRMTYEQLLDHADSLISQAQFATDVLMNEGVIRPVPDD